MTRAFNGFLFSLNPFLHTYLTAIKIHHLSTIYSSFFICCNSVMLTISFITCLAFIRQHNVLKICTMMYVYALVTVSTHLRLVKIVRFVKITRRDGKFFSFLMRSLIKSLRLILSVVEVVAVN